MDEFRRMKDNVDMAFDAEAQIKNAVIDLNP